MPDTSPRLARAELRWRQVQAERPDALRAVELNRALLRRQIALAEDEQFDADGLAGAPPTLADRVGRGTPAFFPPPPRTLPLVRIAESLAGFLGDLARGGAGEAARKIERTLLGGGLDIGAVSVASLARDEGAARDIAAAHGFNLQVLWLAVDLATAPLASRAQERAFQDDATPAVKDALDAWDRGACPACGSWPVLAEFFYGERVQRCAYCACAWRLSTDRCTYCGEHGADFRTVAIDKVRPGRRLELCRRCGGYLKTIDVERPTPFPLLAIEDLATSDLDHAAMHHGFRRIPLAEARRTIGARP